MPNQLERRQNDERLAIVETHCEEMKKTLYGNGRKGIAYHVEAIRADIKYMYIGGVAILGLLIKLVFWG